MKQYDWIYVSNLGKRYHVGLLHSPSSGHLLIFINSRISVVDFSVLETKHYPLFLDDQLCEIRINLVEDQFKYTFYIDEEADTPLNHARKKLERKHFRQSFAFIGGFIILIAVALWAFRYLNSPGHLNESHLSLLEEKGVLTEARLFLDTDSADSTYYYTFIHAGETYRKNLRENSFQNGYLINGFTPRNNDAFFAQYDPENPLINQILLKKPTERQLEKYKQEAFLIQQSNHPDQDEAYLTCLIQQVYDLYQLDGLASVVHQQTTTKVNLAYNQNTYYRIIRSTAFKQAIAKQCFGLE